MNCGDPVKRLANGVPARTIVLLAAVMLVGGGVVAWLAVQERNGEDGPAFESAHVRSYVETEPGPYEGIPITVFEDTVPACAPCDFRLHPVGAFGSAEDSVLLGDTPVMVERDSRGRFYAAVRVAGHHQVILYEPDGRVVRTVGRAGQGPGEFRTSPTSLLPRYARYGRQDVDGFREHFHEGILVYLSLTGSSVSGSGPGNPRINTFSATTEAPDETACGDWLDLVARAGLAHTTAVTRYLPEGEARVEREAEAFDGWILRNVFRTRPVLPVAPDEEEGDEPGGE